MRNFAFASAALFLLVPTGVAQDSPLELLNKVAANYAAMPKTTYSFEQVEVREYSGTMLNRTEQRQRLMGSGGKYRQETVPNGVVYILDGQYRWSYYPERNEYTKDTANPAAAGHPPGLNMYAMVGYQVKGARFLRQETLDTGSGPVLCEVIEADPRPEPADGAKYSPTTYWIDARRLLVLKMRYTVTANPTVRPSPPETTITVSVAKASVGEAADESLFHFAPPSGAVQVDRLTFAPKSALVGQASPDFELQGADGTAISSASLRGHVVLLQFGRRPDDDPAFQVEMIYRSLKAKGLTAYYVLPPRTLAGAGAASGAYTVPVVTDSDGSAAKKLGISYTGTVLIDRAGKIAFVEASVRGSLQLAQALQAAGIW